MKNNQKLVSIVLPVYNGEKYLSQSIESVLNQTYKNLELIIVNDCSTDNSEKIILNYLKKDERVIYHKNLQNKKLPRSLNIGFSYAHGEYLSWTSDDNFFENNAIEEMVNFLETNSQYDMVACAYRSIDTSTLEETIKKVSSDIMISNKIGACFLYTKAIKNKVGCYSENLFLVEDYDYWLRVSDIGKIGILNRCLYNYRKHENSLTQKRKKEVEEIVFKYQYHNRLKYYEKTKIPKDQLFTFFINILKNENNSFMRKIHCIFFSMRHPSFIGWIKQKKKK